MKMLPIFFIFHYSSSQGSLIGLGLWCLMALPWWSVLLVEETGVHRENHRPTASHSHR